MARRRRSRHLFLGAALALGASLRLGAAGCAAGTDPPSKVNALRVLVVAADKSYAAPGETVHFRMEVRDAGEGGEGEDKAPIQIAWIGGCFDPAGDLYYLCFEPIAQAIAAAGSTGSAGSTGAAPAGSEITFAAGPSLVDFSLAIPDDIVSRRPPPDKGPYYGIAYVFFAACAGTLAPVPPSGDGAPSLPFGCFDEAGRALGADRFVPGYTQVYSFADGRQNANPKTDGLLFDGALAPDDAEAPDAMPIAERCALSDDERRAVGCGAPDPYESCASYSLDVLVDEAIAEPDALSPSPNGGPLHEAVWVDYLAEGGDLERDVRLIYGAVEGYHEDHSVRWLPPASRGVATLWAIVRDSRGGATALRRSVRVE